MPDRTVKLRRLIQIMRSFGVNWDHSRGKGSHGMFWRIEPAGKSSYPVPDRTDVLRQYVRGCRKKFRLTPDDGVSDQRFYDA